jgi:hypothetical protein
MGLLAVKLYRKHSNKRVMKPMHLRSGATHEPQP